MMKQAITYMLFLCTFYAYSQGTRTFFEDPNRVPREHPVDMLEAKIELSFEPSQGKVIGKVSHHFVSIQNSISELFLDGIKMDFKSVLVDGKPVDQKITDEGLTIKFSQPIQRGEHHQIDISYEAQPAKGLYFIGWNDIDSLSRRQIWSQGQGIDNRHWIPMYDEMNDKIVSEMIVTFDSKYKVLSNGQKLKEKSNKDGTTTWHYKISHPHAPYLIMLGIGEYEIKESKSSSGVPMYYWYYPDYQDRVDWTYKQSEDIMDFFESEIDMKYPWSSYSQIPVQEFMYGAMENTTATIFGDFYHVDERAYLDRNYVAVNAHELAHQWFGDYVTARSSAHHWLQESFATYYNMMYEKKYFGQDHFDWKRREGNNGALNASEKDLLPIAHSEAGSVRHYPKGAFVLNMLKYVVGEEEFKLAIKHYLETHPYQNVDSEDLLIAFHETLGVSLDWFWEEWVYKGGEPHYKVEFSDMNENEQRFSQFTVNQIHEQNDVVGLFKMPIWFEIHYTDGSSDSQQVWVEDEFQIVRINNMANKEIAYALFDPNNEVMKKVDFSKSVEMNVRQSLSARNMLDRYDAVVAMRPYPIQDKIEVLEEIYSREKFHSIKSEILFQLSSLENEKCLAIYNLALQDDDVLVRKAAVQSLDIIPSELLPSVENLLRDPSYEVIELTLNKLCLEYPQYVGKYLDATKDEIGAIGKNIRMIWLEHAFNSTVQRPYLDELIMYTSQSYEFKTRVNAAQSLQRLNYCNEELIRNLLDAMGSANTRLSNPCSKVLKHFYQQTSYRHQIDLIVRAGEWSQLQQKRILNNLK